MQFLIGYTWHEIMQLCLQIPSVMSHDVTDPYCTPSNVLKVFLSIILRTVQRIEGVSLPYTAVVTDPYCKPSSLLIVCCLFTEYPSPRALLCTAHNVHSVVRLTRMIIIIITHLASQTHTWLGCNVLD